MWVKSLNNTCTTPFFFSFFVIYPSSAVILKISFHFNVFIFRHHYRLFFMSLSFLSALHISATPLSCFLSVDLIKDPPLRKFQENMGWRQIGVSGWGEITGFSAEMCSPSECCCPLRWQDVCSKVVIVWVELYWLFKSAFAKPGECTS